MRILDCKDEKCKALLQGAPAITDNLCDECLEHFDGLKKGLDSVGIEYTVDKNIVRGQDYYTKTVFEFISGNVGAQGTVCGGGRYDGLVEDCGGKYTPGIGFGLGIERLLLEIGSHPDTMLPEPEKACLYIATAGDMAVVTARSIVTGLRRLNVPSEIDLMGRSLKAQMKYADKAGFKYTLVIGEDEIKSGSAALRNMATGVTVNVKLESEAVSKLISPHEK